MIPQNRQFIPNSRTDVYIISAMNHMKTIWGWEDVEKKEGAINFLAKVFKNIMNNPDEEKFRDLNMTKIRKLTKRWNTIPMLILYNCGFSEDIIKGGRMTLDKRDIPQLTNVASLFANCRKFDPTKERVIPEIVKKPVAETVMEVEEPEMEAEIKTENNEDGSKMEIDEPEEPKAENESMDVETVAPKKKEEPEAQPDYDSDLDDLLKMIKAEKQAKGYDTLNMKELAGLTKEEKLALMEEKRVKFRAQKSKNDIEEKMERAKKDREAIKKQADMKQKNEEHQIKMAMEAKKREKLRNKKRKDAARDKIRKQKEERRLKNERLKQAQEAKN